MVKVIVKLQGLDIVAIKEDLPDRNLLAGIDIEDVEAEIKKPENQWNKTKLKKRFTGILAAATAIGIGIAGATDFANTAIDVGQKLGIEVSLPSKP